MRKTKRQPTPEDCADSVLEGLRLGIRFFTSVSRENESARQLTPPQFRVLDYLRRHPGASLSDVANHIGVRQPTASVTVFRLVRNKLVLRATDPKERRRIVLQLSEQGAKLVNETRALVRRRLTALLAEVPSSELPTLLAGLDVLNSVLARHP